ncbi:MAG: NUDIX domain-containing protein [Micrococcales bacterium]|nr:NUDIX domain-containing protein [Micrococcales bacterium]
MPSRSAGLIPLRRNDCGELQIFIAHMGGPFWARKDARAWTIIKGEFDPGEDEDDAQAVARREFAEEVGVEAPPAPWVDLGVVRQKSGKIVHAFAVRAPDVEFVGSNEVVLEWPRGSGRLIRFPEVDRAEWMPLLAARDRLVAGQVPLLDRLLTVDLD